jgi:hypothetical protein
MTSAPESRKFSGHTWLEASLACSSAALRALVSAAVTTALCAFRDCDRRSTSDSMDVTWDSRSLTLWDEGRVRERAAVGGRAITDQTCHYRSLETRFRHAKVPWGCMKLRQHQTRKKLFTLRRSTVAARVFARSRSATTISISANFATTSWSGSSQARTLER